MPPPTRDDDLGSVHVEAIDAGDKPPQRAKMTDAERKRKRTRAFFAIAAVLIVLIIAAVLLFVFVARDSKPASSQTIAPLPVKPANTEPTTESATDDASPSPSPAPGSLFGGSFSGGWGPLADAVPDIGLSSVIPSGFPIPSFGSPPADGLGGLPSMPSITLPTLFRPLKGAAAGTGILFGNIHNENRVWGLNNASETARYEQHLISNYDIITPENACKTATIFRTSPSAPDFTACDRVISWAETNGLKVRLHVLAWGDWNPTWITSTPAAQKRALLIQLITVVLNHYKDRSSIVYWDVVNEAVCDAVRLTPSKQNCNATLGRAADGGLLKGGGSISAWYPDVPDYIDIAFQTARDILGPSQILVYNEYGFESTSDIADPKKHSRVYDWVEAALARGVPIDAVGFQFHIANIHNAEGVLGRALYNGYMDGVKEQFDQIAALGVEVHVTEIDVGCNFPTLPCPAPWLNVAPGSRQLNQAEVFSRILKHCLDTPACTAYQMWGSTDKYSWRDGTWGNGGSLQSWYNQYAHPFDVNYQPKLAAYAMLAVLRAKQMANGYTPPN